MKRNRSRSWIRILSLMLVACSLAACSDDDNPQAPPPPDEIATDLTDPAAVLASHTKALNKKDFVAYAALLDDQFEFYPVESDAQDFPWLQGNSWPIVEELSIIGHMCDPNFAGYMDPVHSMDVTLTILTQRPLVDGRVELLCTMQGEVLTSASDGWAFDTRMLIELVPRDGFLRILKMTEISAVREGGVRVGGSSWGSIKNLYR